MRWLQKKQLTPPGLPKGEEQRKSVEKEVPPACGRQALGGFKGSGKMRRLQKKQMTPPDLPKGEEQRKHIEKKSPPVGFGD